MGTTIETTQRPDTCAATATSLGRVARCGLLPLE